MSFTYGKKIMKQKTNRTITCKPTWFEFGPLGKEVNETLTLPQDELEALYLADILGLYQEDCAKRLNVSRPTFAKLIKNARKKCAEMLLFHKKISILELAKTFTIVYPTDDRVSLSQNFNVAKYFGFAKIKEGSIQSISYIDNPIYKILEEQKTIPKHDEESKGLGAGRLIPPLLKEANVVACKNIGEGMLRNIQGLGINVEITSHSNIDEIVKMLQ